MEQKETKKADPNIEELPIGTNWNELLISSVPPQEIWIKFQNKRWGPFGIKAMGWTKKNKLLNACTSYATDGTSSFNWDKWYKSCLQEILVAPKGFEVTEIFLTSLHEKFGGALEKLCPQPFDLQQLVDKSKNACPDSEQESKDLIQMSS